jgi:hypothetical protein
MITKLRYKASVADVLLKTSQLLLVETKFTGITIKAAENR